MMSIFDIFDKIKSENPADNLSGPVEYIIAGLGNPGLQYENTRHNAGFMTVDTLAEKYNFTIKKLKFKSLCGETMLGGKRCLIMKPSTYMNNSGEALTEAMSFYKIPPEKTIICFDDISLPPSRIRIRRKGSDGGHNGMKSIIYLSGSDSFPRIKIGVGAKPRKDMDLAAWVLSNFTKEELPLIHEAVDKACAALELMTSGKTDEAMNKFNTNS